MPETLYSIIPDPDVVLRLAPEDLAPILLRLARQYLQRDMFTPWGRSDRCCGNWDGAAN